MIKVRMNPEKFRAEALDDDKVIGLCQYKLKDDILDAYHTEVDKDYGGQGLAGKLLDHLVNFARKENKKIYPTCSYVLKKFDQDESYKDVDAR